MQIHELKVKSRKTRKRVGRGGKRGTYSGRGMKGQKSRSGGNVNPLFQGGRASSLIAKLKKVRGFKSIHAKKVVVNLDILEAKMKDGSEVNIKTLVEAKVIEKKDEKAGIKILGDGAIKKKLTISNEILISKSAKAAVEKAGGKVEAAKKRIPRNAKKLAEKDSK